MNTELADLIVRALPKDIDPVEFWRNFAQLNGMADQFSRCLAALRQVPRLNWHAYLASYPDVKAAGVEPCLHFLKHGIYEGRRLASYHPLCLSWDADAIAVSVIVTNYNHGGYLAHTLESVINQSLANLEIIVVDDCSSDDSQAIIHQYAYADPRVKPVFNEANLGTFRARKRGVLAAAGQHVMFVDADDYLLPNACEAAWAEAAKGYDIVSFCMSFYDANSQSLIENFADPYSQIYNTNERLYSMPEMRRLLFEEMSDRDCLMSRIWLRQLLVAAYDGLPEMRLDRFGDALLTLAVSKYARHNYKINKKLYVYNDRGSTHRSLISNELANWFSSYATIAHLTEFNLVNKFNLNLEKYKKFFCASALRKWLEIEDEQDSHSYYQAIYAAFGHILVTGVIIDDLQAEMGCIAQRIANFPPQQPRSGQRKRICLYFETIFLGGTEAVLLQLARGLGASGRQITIFVEKFTKNDHPIPPNIEIVLLPAPVGGNAGVKAHAAEFYRQLRSRQIDIFVSFYAQRPATLYALMACRELGIPALASLHVDFNYFLFFQRYGCNRHTNINILKCFAGVTCLSRCSELHLRKLGVNAVYVPNPIQRQAKDMAPTVIPKTLIFVGRPRDRVKQVTQLLLILREVVKYYPNTVLLVVGGFDSPEQKQTYEEKARKMGIAANIKLVGWSNNPAWFYAQASIFVSASFWEGFPLAISEALAHGLPCVIYELPIEIAADNPAVLSVPFGDYLAAAMEIVALFADPGRWGALSEVARNSVAPYSPEAYLSNMEAFIGNFERYSHIRHYPPKLYIQEINALARYAQNALPEW